MGEDRETAAKYIYNCSSCGYSFYTEAVESAGAPAPTTVCPQCGSPDAHFTFLLNGGGCSSTGC